MKMKKLLTALLALALLAATLLSLAACGIDSKTAKKTLEDLLRAVKEERYSDAVLLLHPSTDMDEAELKSTFMRIRSRYGVKFSDEIALRYVDAKSHLYRPELEGSAYEISAVVILSSRMLYLYVLILDNDEGYGIAALRFSNESEAAYDIPNG